ncbi:MAG: hypothetical protein FIA91_00725 [Geobacter sp.]|nr:hypothetical protein [Geobacter sp.]
MGALSHYLEEEGLATTQISLIREHTEITRPPRALWVPFELGRPFGIPNNRDFQAKVLLQVLSLLEAEKGPVLLDFPEDAPLSDMQPLPFVCPISFGNAAEDLNATDRMLNAFKDEVSQIRSWYDLSLQKTGRTTAGISGLSLEEIAGFFAAFINGERKSPALERTLATALRMAAEDLKACYFEALAIQTGDTGDSSAMADWFWGKTVAAQIIAALRIACLAIPENDFQLLGKLLLVPRTKLHLFKPAGA